MHKWSYVLVKPDGSERVIHVTAQTQLEADLKLPSYYSWPYVETIKVVNSLLQIAKVY